MEKLGLYIHIPFCVKKCNYCDFLSFPAKEEMMEKYVDALINEIFSKDYSEYVVDTIFIGGGTPSVLKPHMIEKIADAIKKHFNLMPYVEWTIEANPGTVTEKFLETCLLVGINRLSLGLQSANNNELQALSRIHTTQDFLDSYFLARNCGFMNINVDLMSAIPYQTRETLRDGIKSVASLKPEHISVYSLILEDGTPLAKWINDGNEDTLCSEEDERLMYYDTEEILKEYGYKRYEVSNYAKPKYECRHNIGYWKRKEYVGFGIGAASLLKNKRYNNIEDVNEYIEKYKTIGDYEASKCNIEELTEKDAMSEFMFLGLRMIEGIDKKDFYKCFNKDFDSIYGEIIKEQIKKKTIIEEGDYIRLTPYGIDVSNVVLAEFLL